MAGSLALSWKVFLMGGLGEPVKPGSYWHIARSLRVTGAQFSLKRVEGAGGSGLIRP